MSLPKDKKIIVWTETLFSLAGESINNIVEALAKRNFVGQLVINFNRKPASALIREKNSTG